VDGPRHSAKTIVADMIPWVFNWKIWLVFLVISDVNTAFDDDAMAAKMKEMIVVVLFSGMSVINVAWVIPRIVVDSICFLFVDHLNSMGMMMAFVNTFVKAEIAMRVEILCSVIAEFSWILARA
jgi:hypothetical protein